MTVSSFSVRQLLASVKAANPSERIYTMVRSVNEDATLTSDLHYIKIILNNLLTNALKYAAPDSLVELEICSQTTDHGKAIEFTVSNEVGAAGLPDPERLFERFYRAEAARNQSGAGLGLWLSQSLAHALSSQVFFTAHDGKVSCRFALQLS
jgi:signal transduction histidine kinase